ncbi:hypothetical protein B484DRAFT_437437, partial [Ochromonadaceae sp. CCMP2298]
MNPHRASSTGAIDNLVAEFLVLASDAVLQERRGIVNPITNSSAPYSDIADYCRQFLAQWRRDLSRPLMLDVYIFDPKVSKHILLERWRFEYLQRELRDARQLAYIHRRILTLVRSLYCFVRLLPGFHLTNLSPRLPTLSVQLYERKASYPTSFASDVSAYAFNP